MWDDYNFNINDLMQRSSITRFYFQSYQYWIWLEESIESLAMTTYTDLLKTLEAYKKEGIKVVLLPGRPYQCLVAPRRKELALAPICLHLLTTRITCFNSTAL